MPGLYPEAPYLAVVRGTARRVLLAAVRTPPRNLIISEVDDEEAVAALVDDLVGSDLPGVLGPKGDAATFARAWSARTGRRHRLESSERIFRLTGVRQPRPVPGRLRGAAPRDRDLLIEWLGAFAREALHETDASGVPALVDAWLLGREGRTIYLWEDGAVVSLCGAGAPTPNGVRIGPVYTPAQFRGRGYASACVAAASQAQLDAGRRFCFLFTDLANPTSNHIYQEIGYEPVRDVEVYRFGEP